MDDGVSCLPGAVGRVCQASVDQPIYLKLKKKKEQKFLKVPPFDFVEMADGLHSNSLKENRREKGENGQDESRKKRERIKKETKESRKMWRTES